MGKPFSPERLANIRRIRKARRIYASSPLFALYWLQQEIPQYSAEQLADDLRRRSRKKKRTKKSPLQRYGRYSRMTELLRRYEATGEVELALQAIKLRDRITQPYHVRVTVYPMAVDFALSPMIPLSAVEQLMAQVSTCKSIPEAAGMIDQLNRDHRLS